MEDECPELVCPGCDPPTYDYSLVNYPLYTNEEISFFVPCAEGMVCTDEEGNVIPGVTITIPAGTYTYRPTTSSGNSQDAANRSISNHAQSTAAGGGGTVPTGGPGSQPSGPRLNPKPKMFYNVLVDVSCPEGAVGEQPALIFFVGPGHVVIPPGIFSSPISQAAANAAATATANALLSYANCKWFNDEVFRECPSPTHGGPIVVPAGAYSSTISKADADQQAEDAADELVATTCYWESTLQSYTATCPEDRYGIPVTKTKAAGEYTSFISQADADSKALTAATEEAQAELQCFLYQNTEQTAECPPGYTGDPVTVPPGTAFSNVSQEDADSQALAIAQGQLDCTADCAQNLIDTLSWNHTGGGTASGSGGAGSLQTGSNSNCVLTSTGITNECGFDFEMIVTVDYTVWARTINFNPHTCTITIQFDGVTQNNAFFTSSQCGNAFCDCQTDSNSVQATIPVPDGTVNKAIGIILNSASDDQGCADNSASFTVAIV